MWKQVKVMAPPPSAVISEWTRTEFLCDVCGELAHPTLRIGNEVIAELCESHALMMRLLVEAKLKTKPGPVV